MTNKEILNVIKKHGLEQFMMTATTMAFIYGWVSTELYPMWKSENMTLECFLELNLSCQCGECSPKKIDMGKNLIALVMKHIDENPDEETLSSDVSIPWVVMLLEGSDELLPEHLAKEILNNNCWN